MNRMIKPALIGHRCAGYLAPENTLAAIYTALRMGLDGIECDLQVTSDGEIVLFHDATLTRTTDGVGSLVEYPLVELQTLDAGGWFDYIYQGEKIPTLQEALGLIDGRLTAFLELKQPSSIDRVADIIQQCRAGEWCTLISFSEHVLAQCAQRMPDIPRAFLIQPDTAPNPAELIDHLAAIPADIIGVAPRWLDSDLIRKIKQSGVRIMTGPVDTDLQCQESFPLGADFIITNQPDVIKTFADTYPTV